MSQTPRALPIWAVQLIVGMAIVLLAVAVFAAVVGTAVRGPGQFFEELGRTVARVAPQPQADLRNDDQVRSLIRAMPEGKTRVASIVEEQDRIIFTVTAERAAVKAAVRPGDELRLSRTTGEVEIAPTGIPGAIDRLKQEIDALKERFFGR